MQSEQPELGTGISSPERGKEFQRTKEPNLALVVRGRRYRTKV